MREPKISFRRASRPATSPWRTILGGAALATTIGVSRRSRAGAHL